MKYKVGDKVKVRSWESMKKEFGLNKNGSIKCRTEEVCFIEDMKEYCWEIVTIKEAINNIYKVKEDSEIWNFTDDMFETVDFDWEAFKNPDNKIAVHCKTEKEAKDFCKQMHEHGMKWTIGNSYLDKTYFDEHKEETCYTGYVTFSSYYRYKTLNFTILEWSDYFMSIKKEFTLSDLKDEMIVESREGNRYIVLGENFIREEGFNRKTIYDECFKNKKHNDLDIIAVYPPSKNYGRGLNGMLTPNAKPIWEEKKKIVIPDDCKNILKIIDKKYNWIAKDSDGAVCIYKDKPVKEEKDWEDRKYDFETLTKLFDGSLFDWLSWDNEEPVNLREVLKGEE